MPNGFLDAPLPPRPFIGRKKELKRLEDEVYRREIRSAFQPIVIRGESGVGKTALAAAFCENRTRRRSLWIPCRNWKSSVQPFERLLRDRFIEAREAMVVLDGADEIPNKEFFELFHTVSNFKLVRTLLVTSRVELGVRGEREIFLERISDGDAESLLRRRLSLGDLDEDSVGKLVKSVHGHPLAATLIANMAHAMSPEQLRRVLAGHLYDLNDATPAVKRELVGVAKPIIISANEAMVAALKKQPRDVFKLSPRQYEELIAELLRDMGYDVTLTQATRDGGKDILASIKTECGDVLCLVDAKKYREDRKIGVSMVRTLYGTLCDYQATSAMLVSTSTYSADARALQQKHRYQLSLRDYTDVAVWIQRYGSKKQAH